MRLQLLSSPTSEYVILEDANLKYSVNKMRFLTRVLETEQNINFSSSACPPDLEARVKELVEQDVRNIRRIAEQLELTVQKEGVDCLIDFEARIQESADSNLTELNLSNRGLDGLPYHIGLFRSIRKLDLSNNNLRILPMELISLAEHGLTEINLKGNPICEIPKWLENTGINIISDLEFDTENWAQLPISDSDEMIVDLS